MDAVSKNQLPLIITFLAIVIAVALRACFFLSQYYIVLAVDGYEYYDWGYYLQKTLTLPTLVNPYRTPAYPLVLSIVFKPKYPLVIDQMSPDFFRREQYLMLLQHLAGIGSIFCVWLLLKRTQLHPLSQAIILILYGIYKPLISLERTLLTEAFSTFFLLLCVLLLIKSKEKRRIGFSHIGFIISSGILFLFRPFYILLPFLFAIVTGIYVPSWKQKIVWLTLSLSVLVLPVSFMTGNYVYHGFEVVNLTSTINVLGRIIQFPLTLPSTTKEEKSWSETIKVFRKTGSPLTPYEYINWFHPEVWHSPKAFQFMQAYTGKAVWMNASQYIYYSLLDIPKCLIDHPALSTQYFTKGILTTKIINATSVIARCIDILSLILIPAGLYWIIQALVDYFRNRKLPNFSITIFVVVVVYSIFLAVFDGYEDYGRLTISMVGISMILTWISYEYIVRMLIKKKTTFLS